MKTIDFVLLNSSFQHPFAWSTVLKGKKILLCPVHELLTSGKFAVQRGIKFCISEHYKILNL